MPEGILTTVPRPVLVQHMITSLERYWPRQSHRLKSLPVKAMPFPSALGPLRLVAVRLPDWADETGIEGNLLVPTECCPGAPAPVWDQIDWWLAAFLLLECWHEREREIRHGPVHSYSFRLKEWDARAWDRAWVNRIALFIREWAARREGEAATILFGALPKPRICMTHDVDAVKKTWAIRTKQGAFLAFNSARLLVRGNTRGALNHLAHAARFVSARNDWWTIPKMQQLEREAGIRSRFHFYADSRRKTPKRWLLDPSYDVAEARFRGLLSELAEGGWEIGLHPAYDAWQSSNLIEAQRRRLQSVSPVQVNSCRQHWLRFSWADTWRAQAGAGIREDTTLMFNDRPGFRAAAALSWTPWNTLENCSLTIRSLPTVLMDSQFYDYETLDVETRQLTLRHWTDEIKAVRGEIAVLWHPHTITADYGWGDGYRELLAQVAECEACEIQ